MIKITDLPTRPPDNVDRKALERKTEKLQERLDELHQLLRADGRYSVLVVLQGMDASGKDGAVKNVFRKCSHLGIHVHAFKKPTKEELAHDFLWRCHQKTPAHGEIVIWNRSHYEDVLIQRVHGWIDEKRVTNRMQAINHFERLLWEDNNTLVLKYFLNLSYEQQYEELMERIDEREKNYKYNDGDWEQRKYWQRYMECYEDVLNRCNDTPWVNVPVDARWYRNYVMTRHLVEQLEALPLVYPNLPDGVNSETHS